MSTTHGRSSTSEYRIWTQMRSRCNNPSNSSYARYGGRGITVCSRWDDDFEAFLEDMGPRPSSEHSVDRVNNDKGYEPANCQWATPVEQANNRRTSSFLTYKGKTQTIAQWALELEMSPHTIRRRLEEGWSAAAALSITPRRTGKRLSKEQVAQLEQMHADGWSNVEIAAQLGVTSSAVSYRLKKRKKK